MPKGVYEKSEEQKRKIGEARIRYYDEHGRVVNTNQKENPEAYRAYQREYQKLWRKRFPHYYRDLKRKKKEAEDMSKLQESEEMKKTMKHEVEELKNEITRLQNVIADLEMKISSQNVSSPKEYIDDNLYKSVLPSTQACSEEELLKFTEHK